MNTIPPRRRRTQARPVAPFTATTTLTALAALAMLAGCSSHAPSEGTRPMPSASAPSQAPSQTATTEAFTPIIARALSEPIATPASDGRTHLAYELQLTNTLSQTVALDGITVSSDAGELLTLADRELAARTLVIGGGDPSSLGPGQSALVLLDVALDASAGTTGTAFPSVLQHQLRITPQQAMPPVFDSPLTESLPPVALNPGTPVVIGPPLKGDKWLDGNSCCDVTPHRTAINPVNGEYHVPERYAIDFIQLDDTRRAFDGPIDRLTSYPYEGSEVIAVADGPVVAITSDRPEQTPGANPPGGLTLDEYGGNYVVQDIGDGRYAFYAHLQPGNPIGITVGQQLSRGETLGLLGNSGNSSGPHLHFHVMNSPLPLASDGLPFTFDSYTLAGTVTEEGLQACLVEAIACGENRGNTSTQRATSPLYRDVLNFP